MNVIRTEIPDVLILVAIAFWPMPSTSSGACAKIFFVCVRPSAGVETPAPAMSATRSFVPAGESVRK